MKKIDGIAKTVNDILKGNRYSIDYYQREFAEHRNLIGDLLLLPKSFNASYNDDPYGKKLPHYLEQNLLARTLHPQAYVKNPGFLRFADASGLPFKPYETFTKSSIVERGQLYRAIALRVWNPDDLLQIAALGPAGAEG